MPKEPLSRRGFLGVTASAAVLPQAPARPATGRIKIVAQIPQNQITAEDAAAIRRLSPNIDLVLAANREEAYAQIENADAFFGSVDQRLLRLAKQLKWVQHPAAGVEGIIGIPELAKSDLVLTNMQRVYAPVISETAIGLLLALNRGFPTYIRQADQKVWKPAPNMQEISNKTMGVIGFGGLGSETARRAHDGFQMRIIATDAKPMFKPHWVEELRDPTWQDELLKRSDAVVIAAPETAKTRGMVNEEFLRKMKKSAYLIAISRGPLYDGAAVTRALKEGWIAGAGLDVTPREPLPADDPLWSAPNSIITVHSSGQAPERRGRMVGLFIENVRRYVNGLPLMNVVDKNAGY
jgi:phosphoglycerate dehydrogenase-like enzyme